MRLAWNLLKELTGWTLPAAVRPESKKSTSWMPKTHRRTLIPTDIMMGDCPCKQLAKFGIYIGEDCKDVDVFILTRQTIFFGAKEIIPTLLHSIKFTLLSLARCHGVATNSIVRGQISAEESTYFKILASYEDWQAADPARKPCVQQGSQSAAPWDGTDKHKLLWLCHLPELLAIIKQNSEVARSAPATSSSAPPGLAQRAGQQRNSNVALVTLAPKLWETGSLHIVISAPRQEYSRWRMTLEPAVKLEEDQVEAEYFGILL